jgi:hypothetical protein
MPNDPVPVAVSVGPSSGRGDPPDDSRSDNHGAKIASRRGAGGLRRFFRPYEAVSVGVEGTEGFRTPGKLLHRDVAVAVGVETVKEPITEGKTGGQ